MTPVPIRRATIDDIPDLALLIQQLGHEVTKESIAMVWQSWIDEGNVALVIEHADSVKAMITLHRMVVLHRPKPVGRITSLVVDTAVRGQGFGKALVLAAEDLFKETGCGLIEVTSNKRLTAAHEFYRHHGYAETSHRFAKYIT
jgi:ribosomal protein S18 acetylase RimI-like enzyme